MKNRTGHPPCPENDVKTSCVGGTMRRLYGLILCLCMVLGLFSVPVYAAESTYTITINNSESGHTYKAYQIFSGDLYEEMNASIITKTVLSNVKAGTGLKSDYNTSETTLAAALKANSTLQSYFSSLDNGADAAAIAEAISDANIGNSSDAAIELAKVLNNYKTGDGTSSGEYDSTNHQYKITGLSAGYYLVVDTVQSSSGTTPAPTVSSLILQVFANRTINAKANAPTLDKKITAIKDAENRTVNGILDLDEENKPIGTIAEAPIGGTVSFTLTSKVPELTGYTAYTYEITDTLSDGLSYVATSGSTSNVVVKIGDNTLTNSASDTSAAGTCKVAISGQTLTITIPMAALQKTSGGTTIDRGTAITVTYDAKVNTSASKNYEKNSAKLKYSNDPQTSASTTETPEENTYVVGVDVNVLKVDSKNTETKLSGAQFKLYRLYQEVSSQTGAVEGQVAGGGPTVKGSEEKQYYTWDSSNGVTWVTDSSDTSDDDDDEDDEAGAKPNPGGWSEWGEETSSSSSRSLYTPMNIGISIGGSEGGSEGGSSSSNSGSLGTVFTTNSNGTFETAIKGLMAGTYYLEEIKAPDGYNLLTEPIKVIITVARSGQTVTYSYKIGDSGTATTVENGTVTLSSEAGSSRPLAKVTVQNTAGAVLPSTGGIGTTIFYVIGGVLIVGAAVLLISRRRRAQ